MYKKCKMYKVNTLNKNKTLAPTVAIIAFLLYLIIKNNLLIYGDEPEIAETAINMLNGYKAIFRGNLSIIEPQSYLYGSIYTYIFFAVTFPITLIRQILGFPVSDKNFFYLFFRVINLGIFTLSLVYMYKILRLLELKNRNYRLWALFLWVINPIFIARSQFINQDVLALSLFSISSFYYLKYLNNKEDKYIFIYFFISGLTISAKITYIIPLIFSTFFYLYIDKKVLLKKMVFLILPLVSYIISFPYSVVNFHRYFNRLIELKALEAGIALDSYNLNPLYYLEKNFIYLFPILIYIIYKIYKKKMKMEWNLKTIYIVGLWVSLILFFSVQIRKTDRWGMPIYFLGYILVIYYLYKSRAKKIIYTLLQINAFILISMIFPILVFFTQKDPRNILRKYVERNTKNTYAILSEHGNNDEVEKNTNVSVFKHKIYENKDDLTTYFPYPEIEKYDYLIISNGAIRDFYNRYSLSKYKGIRSWNNYINNLTKVDSVGSNKIRYEPEIGFTIYKVN